MAETIRVETKSAWYSKINWTQVAQAVVTLLTTNAFGLDDATQVKVLAGTTLATNLGTIILKTFFTPTITPASESASGRKTMTLD